MLWIIPMTLLLGLFFTASSFCVISGEKHKVPSLGCVLVWSLHIKDEILPQCPAHHYWHSSFLQLQKYVNAIPISLLCLTSVLYTNQMFHLIHFLQKTVQAIHFKVIGANDGKQDCKIQTLWNVFHFTHYLPLYEIHALAACEPWQLINQLLGSHLVHLDFRHMDADVAKTTQSQWCSE